MGNCFSCTRHLNFLVDCLVTKEISDPPADDQLRKESKMEGQLSLTNGREGLISPVGDRVSQELPEGQVSPADDQVRKELPKEDEVSSVGYQVRKELPKESHVCPINDQVRQELPEEVQVSPMNDEVRKELPKEGQVSPDDDDEVRQELPKEVHVSLVDHQVRKELPNGGQVTPADYQVRQELLKDEVRKELPKEGGVTSAEVIKELPKEVQFSPDDDRIRQELPKEGQVSAGNDQVRKELPKEDHESPANDQMRPGLPKKVPLSPADDLVRQELRKEEQVSTTDDRVIKTLPKGGHISDANDQVRKELVKGGHISHADDQVRKDLPEEGQVHPADDQVQLPKDALLSLVSIVQLLESLEKNHGLSLPLKDQIHKLKVELRFVITYLKGMAGKDSKHNLGKPIEDIFQDAARKLFSLRPRLSIDRSVTTELRILISGMQKEMDSHKRKIRFNYLTFYFDSKRNAAIKNKLVMELVDSLLENLQDLQSCETNLIISVKTQIQALKEKLEFVKDLFRFSAMGSPSPWLVGLKDCEDSNEHKKLDSLLIHIEYFVDNAAFLSYCCLVDAEDEHLRLKCNFAYLVWMIKHIEPDIKEISVTFLKDLKPSNSETVPFNLHKVVTIDCLLDNLVMLINRYSQFTNHNIKDNLEILYNELMFLRTFYMDPPPRKHTETKRLDGLFTDVESSFSNAKSVISSFLGKMELGNAGGMNPVLSDLLAKIDLIKAEVKAVYDASLNHVQSNLLGIDGVGYINLLLKNLVQLLNHGVDSAGILNDHIQTVYLVLSSLRHLLLHNVGERDKHEFQDLMKHAIEVAYKAEYFINSYVVRDCPIWNHMLWISDLLQEFKVIDERIAHFPNDQSYHVEDKKNAGKITPLLSAHAYTEEEGTDNFQDEADKIIEKLIGGSKNRDVVSIVGMPGLGKTTLAKMAYNDQRVDSHFDIRAWCCVSQSYEKRKLLLGILSPVIKSTGISDDVSNENLAETLYKNLKGRRYLILMDDMWNMDAWNDVSRLFPDDQNGSRIMITSRIVHVALQVNPRSSPHHLRLLSEEESWKLFKQKLSQQEKGVVELEEIREEITSKCNGLPRAIVAMAEQLAKKEKEYKKWKQIAESLSLLKDLGHILEPSYNHLPQHLKPCFLYFGAFAAGKEVSLKKLLRLWIAERFVHKSRLKSVEETAEDYMMELINQSLVIADKKGANGGVKTCHVHPVLHDFCLAKAQQENFLQLVNGYDELFAPYTGDFDSHSHLAPFCSSATQQVRLSIYCSLTDFFAWKPANKQVRTLLFYGTDSSFSTGWTYSWDLSAISYSLKLLKVLDLSCSSIGDSFPIGIKFLTRLKYLGVRGGMNSIPSSIENLVHLEILFVKGVKGEVEIPDTIEKLVKLKHLIIQPRAIVRFLAGSGRPAFRLHSIETLGTICFSCGDDMQSLIRVLPSLRNFKCFFKESWKPVSKSDFFPVMDSLRRLESLKVVFEVRARKGPSFNFPSHLRKLSLRNSRFPWSIISEIGRLPNLQVLKLFKAFEGESWEMNDGKFPKLKYLKLDTLNLATWNATTDHFPCLERLVLHRCKYLEELPSCLGRVATLQLIEMKWCNKSAEKSAESIQEEQNDSCNEEFKLFINTT